MVYILDPIKAEAAEGLFLILEEAVACRKGGPPNFQDAVNKIEKIARETIASIYKKGNNHDK